MSIPQKAALKTRALNVQGAEDAGYHVLATLAKDNPVLGFDVIRDTVNPIELTRKLWAGCDHEARASLNNIEVIWSDSRKHRCRVETRQSDIKGLSVPTWDQVTARHYAPRTQKVIVVDTSNHSVLDCIDEITAAWNTTNPDTNGNDV